MNRPASDPGPSRGGPEERQDDQAESERAATHRGTEDVAPGVIKDGHGEIQPDPYPARGEDAGNDREDRSVIEQHRADASELEHHRTAAANETLGTVVEPDESDVDPDRSRHPR